ncbi:MAG: DUF2784 domain-containing protein [Pseudomonadota bacterium]
MGYRLLADAVLVLHLAFIVYAVFGGLLVMRRPRTAWLHLPAVAWAGAVECAGWRCPLTHLENHFRIKAGLEYYGGGFIEHLLNPVVYPEGLTRSHQILLGGAVLLLNVVIYVILVIHNRRR